MTLNEMMEKLANEMAKDAIDNEEKGKILEDLGKIVNTAKAGDKIDGCELFDVCHRFNKEFPDYVSAIIAMSMIGWFGVDAGLVEFGEGFTSLDVGDILGGAEIEGEE